MEYKTIAGCSPQFAIKVNDLLSDICIGIVNILGPSLIKYTSYNLAAELNDFYGKIGDGQEEDKLPLCTTIKKTLNSKSNGDETSLLSLTPKEKEINRQMSYWHANLLRSFNLNPLYHRAVFSLVVENIKEEDKKLLEKDANFKRMLTELNTQFKNKYTTFFK